MLVVIRCCYLNNTGMRAYTAATCAWQLQWSADRSNDPGRRCIAVAGGWACQPAGSAGPGRDFQHGRSCRRDAAMLVVLSSVPYVQQPWLHAACNDSCQWCQCCKSQGGIRGLRQRALPLCRSWLASRLDDAISIRSESGRDALSLQTALHRFGQN